MTTSSAQTDEDLEALKGAAAALLSAGVVALQGVGGGRNSRVYRLTADRSGSFALKVYFRHASDGRARMDTEFSSLKFLRENGVRNVPRPIVNSQEHSFAIYEWIEGRGIGPQDVNSASVQAATTFLGRLAELRLRPESMSLQPASEACFSCAAIIENLRRRLDALLKRANDRTVSEFLSGAFIPAFERISNWSRSRAGDNFDRELRQELRTLSPSDFGFHNALQSDTGEVFFLDLEYFGWDDPAKTISDFLLHPAMGLSPAFKRQFAESVARQLSYCSGLAQRVKVVYPLFGLKWCLILLNEFLPEHLLRRRFAGMTDHDWRRKQTEQLGKAENMLRETLSEYEHFPYLD